MKILNKGLKWVFEFILRRKLGLKKGAVGGDIKWHESETVLSGLAISIYGIYEIIRLIVGPLFGFTIPQIPEKILGYVASILGGTIVWGRWTSERDIE